ncbi:MAG: hypothetical protein U0401_17725 [Anaerolineae bacterium]
MLLHNQERASLIAELQAAKQELELAHQQEVELAALWGAGASSARDMQGTTAWPRLVTLSVQLEAVQRLYPVNPKRASRQINELKPGPAPKMDLALHPHRPARAGKKPSALGSNPGRPVRGNQPADWSGHKILGRPTLTG